MSDFTKKSFLSALPPGPIWRPLIDDDYDKLIDGIAENVDVSWEMVQKLAYIRDPRRTDWLEELEREYGIIPLADATEDERREQLAARVYELARWGGLTQLQRALHRAGYTNLFVYHNLPPVHPSSLSVTELVVNGPLYSQVVTPSTCASSLAPASNDMFAGEANAIAGLNVVTKVAQTYAANFDVFAGALWGSDLLSDGDMETPTTYDDWELSSGLVSQIVDGDFETSSMAYWLESTANITAEKSTENVLSNHRCMVVTGAGTFNPANDYLYQLDVAYPGHVYRITGAARSVDGVAAPAIGITGAVAVFSGTSSTSWQTFDVLVTVPYTAQPNTGIGLTMDVAGVVAFDNLKMFLADELLRKTTSDPHAGTQCLELYQPTLLTDGDMSNATLQDGLTKQSRSDILNPDWDMMEDSLIYWTTVAGFFTKEYITADRRVLKMVVENPTGTGDVGRFEQQTMIPGRQARVGFKVRGDGSDIVPSIVNSIGGTLWTGVGGTTAWQTGGFNTTWANDGTISMLGTSVTAVNGYLEWEYISVEEVRNGTTQVLTPFFAEKSLNDKFDVAHTPTRCLQVSNSYIWNGDFMETDLATASPTNWNTNSLATAVVQSYSGLSYRCSCTVTAATTTGNYLSQQSGAVPTNGLTRYRLRARVQKLAATANSLQVFMSDGTVLHDAGSGAGLVEIDEIIDLDGTGTDFCIGYQDGVSVVTNDLFDVIDITLTRISGLSPDDLKWDFLPPAGTAVATGLSDSTSFDKMGDNGYIRLTTAAGGTAKVRNFLQLLGKYYRISGRARSYGGGTPVVRNAEALGDGIDVWTGTTEPGWQEFDVLVELSPSYEYLGLAATGCVPGAGADFDMVTVAMGQAYEFNRPHVMYPWSHFAPGINVIDDLHFQGMAKGDGFTRPQIEDSTGTVLWTGEKSREWQSFSFDVARADSDGIVLTMNDRWGTVYFDDTFLDKTKSVLQYGYPAAQNTFPFTPVSNPGRGAGQNGFDYFWIEGWARGDGIASPQIYVGDHVIWTGVPDATWQQYSVYFIATGIPRLDEEHVVKIGSDMWYGGVFFDDMSVKKGDITEEGESLVDIFYIGAEGATVGTGGQLLSLDTAYVDADMMDRVKEIILRNKPLFSWCGFKVAPTP